MLKKLSLFSLILVLFAACQSVEDAVIATATAPPLPTLTPATTLPSPEPAGFPYVPALNEALPVDNLVLAMHFYADTVGHVQGDEYCYDIGIYGDETYIALSCLPGFEYPAPNGKLNENQSKYLHQWVDTFQSISEPSIHGLLVFNGRGETVPGYSDMVSMKAMIGEIDWTAHVYVHRGGYPPVVFHAREVLSHQLNKWLDNSSILNFESTAFPESCLGAPRPNETCEQVVTQGFRIQFVVDGLLYEFHTDVFGYDIRVFGEPQIAPTKGPAG